MKKLFVLAVLCLIPLADPTPAAAKSHKGAPPKAVPVTTTPVTPGQPKPPKPGFWERTWDSAKTGTKKVWSATSSVVASPFRGKSARDAESKPGWRDLAVNITVTPEPVKLPATTALRVKVTVVNHGKHGVPLDFPDAQRVTVSVRDDAGRVRAKASEEQKGESEGFLIINPEERLEYAVTLPTHDLSAGTAYTLEAIFPAFPELHASHNLTPVR